MRSLRLFWIGVALVLAACRGPSPSAPQHLVHDGLGRAVRLDAEPRRVVSLSPGVTESLLALGYGDRLVGVSDFCRLPSNLGHVTRVGGLLTPNLESIRSLHPDLLIGTTSGNDPGLADQAAGLGLTLYVVHTPDVESMLRSLENIGEVMGDAARGRQVARTFRARLEEVARGIQGHEHPRVLFIVWGDPLVVPGREAFLSDAVRLAGGASVTAEAASAYPTYSLESAIAAAPEVILMTPDNAALAERLRHDPAWAGVPALRSGRVHVVGESVVQPGPGVIAGIEEMAGLFRTPAAASPSRP